MITLGLTGGIGMGKSTCAERLRLRGARVVDTDVLARQAVEPGQPALQDIRACFGPEFIDSDGGLDRERLAGLVFADPTARRKLEAILHPRIRKLWQEQIEQWRAQSRAAGPPAPDSRRTHEPGNPAEHPRPEPDFRSLFSRLAVVVIPLLFETNAQAEVDATLCLACSAATQRERLQPRGWSDVQIHQRISAQWPSDQKMAWADFVIWTEAGLDLHDEQLDLVIGRLEMR